MGMVRSCNIRSVMTVPLKNVSLAEGFNSDKENANDENLKGAPYARIQARGSPAGRQRPKHRGRCARSTRRCSTGSMPIGRASSQVLEQQARERRADGNQPARGRAGTREDKAGYFGKSDGVHRKRVRFDVRL